MAENPLHEKPEEHTPRYLAFMKPEVAEALYEKILYKFVVEKKYRDPDYSAAKMAGELGANRRFVSATLALRYGGNYSQMANEYRAKEAMYMLKSPHYEHYSLDEVARTVGFTNRQTFYLAFRRHAGMSPRAYRTLFAAGKKKGKGQK